MNRGILALPIEDDAGGGADGVIDRNSSGLVSRWFFGWVRSLYLRLLRASLLADALFVSLVMSSVGTSILLRRRYANSIPAGFSLSFIVAQFGALETVVGDFLRHRCITATSAF
jgi:hypothetical protein